MQPAMKSCFVALAAALSNAFGGPVDLHVDYLPAVWVDASAHP